MKISRILESIESAGSLAEYVISGFDVDQEALYDELWLIASNDGDSYKKRDAKGAVEKAFREHQRDAAMQLRDDYSVVKERLIKDLAKRWQNEDVEVGDPLEEQVSFSKIHKAARNVVNEGVWQRELAKLGLDVERIPLSADDIAPYIGPIITLMLTRNGHEVDAASKSQAKMMFSMLRKLAAESDERSFGEMLAEASGGDKAYSFYVNKAHEMFLNEVAKGIKKVAGGKAERVDVKGRSVVWLEYYGQDSSDMDLEFNCSLIDKAPDVTVHWDVRSAYTGAGKDEGSMTKREGVLKPSDVVALFSEKFGR